MDIRANVRSDPRCLAPPATETINDTDNYEERAEVLVRDGGAELFGLLKDSRTAK